jgi:hypothetical protein
MKDELPELSKHTVPLDQRFAKRPHVRERLHEIADMMDKAITEGATADKAEALAIEQLQQLGSGVLTDWAEQKQQDSLQKAQKENPSAVRHIKKK